MTLPHTSDMALKEWAVAVKALARGEQALILRKGGIHRDDRDFRLVHPEFLLFPTYLHQKSELIKPEHHETLRETVSEDDTPGVVELGYYCQVVEKFELARRISAGLHHRPSHLDGRLCPQAAPLETQAAFDSRASPCVRDARAPDTARPR